MARGAKLDMRLDDVEMTKIAELARLMGRDPGPAVRRACCVLADELPGMIALARKGHAPGVVTRLVRELTGGP